MVITQGKRERRKLRQALGSACRGAGWLSHNCRSYVNTAALRLVVLGWLRGMMRGV